MPMSIVHECLHNKLQQYMKINLLVTTEMNLDDSIIPHMAGGTSCMNDSGGYFLPGVPFRG